MKKTRRTKANRKRIFSALVSFLLILAMVGSLTSTAMASQPEEADAEEETAETPAADTDAVEEPAAATDAEAEPAAAIDAEGEPAVATGAEAELSHVSVFDETAEPTDTAEDPALLTADADEEEDAVVPLDDEGAQAYAVYTQGEEASSLIFYYGEVPEGKYVYTGMDTDVYEAPGDVPWAEVAEHVKSVSFDESFADVKPVSTSCWFANFTECATIDLENLDTSNVTTMYAMFYNCQKVKGLDVSGFDTSNVEDMAYMFWENFYLGTPGVDEWDTSSLKDAYRLFDGCLGFTGVDLSGWDMSNVEDISYMFCTTDVTDKDMQSVQGWDTSSVTHMDGVFYECTDVTSLDLSKWDVSNVTSMKYLFENCSGLESVNFTGWNTSSVTTMRRMFRECTALAGVDVSGFDMENVTDTTDMFYDCKSLASLDVSNFETGDMTDMSGMFSECNSLASLDVTSFDTSNVTDMSYMFQGCAALTSLNVTSFDTSNVTDMTGMFEDCEKLEGINLNSFNTRNVEAFDQFLYDCVNLEWVTIGDDFDLFARSTKDNEVLSIATWYDLDGEMVSSNYLIGFTGGAGTYVTAGENATIFAVYSADDDSLTFYYDEAGRPAKGEMYHEKTVTDVFIGFDMLRYTAEHVPWHSYREDIVSVVVDASFEKVEPVSAAYWFYDFANCTSFDLAYLDTSLETDMTDLFCGCSSVETLDLSGFDTSGVTDMESMFDACTSLQEITWGEKFDTSGVTDMSYMFYGCKSLTELDLSKFNTSSVTSMEGMFFNSTALTGLDLSNFDTSKVTTMESMFQGCTSLAELDLSGWKGKTSSVTTMLTMFQGCTGLQKLDATGLVSSNVTNLQDMFYGCSALAELEMSDWDTSGVEIMHRMFRECSSLTEIDVSEWDTENVTQFSQMFHTCSGLTELDLSHFKTTNLNTMANMFNGCSSLETLNLRGWDTSGTTLMASEFSGCTSLTTIYVNEGDFDTSHEENDSNMFLNCYSIVGGNGTTYDENNIHHDMAHVDTPDNPGYFTDYTLFAVYCDEDGSLTVYGDREVPAEGDTYNEKEATAVYTDILDTGEEAPPWEDVKADILTVSCEESIESFSPRSFYEWFSGMENCTSVDLTYLNTTDAAVYTNMMTGMDKLEILSIGENFTLFTESTAALVPQQNWYDADGVQRSDDYMIGISDAGTYYTNPCYLEHHFLGEPVYTWAEDYSSCTAAFTCECGEVTETVDCTVTSKTTTGETLFTATCEFNGNVYTDEVPSKKIDVSGTITWDDANNQDGKRPGFVTAQLFAQDSDEGILYSWDFEVPAPADPEYDADGNEVWTWTRTDLDQYYSGGEEVKYTVIYEGVDLDVYEQTVPNDLDTIYSYTPETTTISGSKTWVDDNDAEGLRPESITVRVHANGSENVYTQTVTADDDWAWTFEDLPVYSNGHPITYTLTEDAVDNYDATYDGWDITNTLDEGNTSVTVLKDWEDAGDQDGKRPESVTVKLLADGQETGETMVLSEENDWEDDFTGLAIYSGGVRIQYTVEEIEIGVEGYTSELTGDAAEGFVFTNSYTPELLNGDGILTGTKVWDDVDDQDGIRPTSIYVHLLADGIATRDAEVNEDAEGKWTFAFDDLDKYANGTEIEYTVEEVLDSHLQDAYTGEVTGSVASGFTITNTHTPELLNGDGTLTVTKVWDDADDQDGLRPASVTVHLLADGEEIDTATLSSETEKISLSQPFAALFTGTRTMAADVDGWTAIFTDLPKYRDGGVEIIYTITEDGVDGYETAVSGDTANGFAVTNTHTPATITLSGQKIWDDANDQDGKRPVSVTINLLADGKAALDENGKAITAVVNESDEGDWDWSFENLPQYRDGGTEIAYTMEEDMSGLADGYTATTTGSMEEGFTITNSYTPELYNGDGTFKVVVAWDDEANNDGIRPEEVNVKLTKDQTTVAGAEMTLTAADDWTGTFTDLPKYENGKEITYSVKEDVKSGYTYRIELLTDESGNTYVQLTNVHVSVKEDIEVTKIWDDNDDQDGKRPESITVRLLTNGNLYKEKVLTADTEGVTVSDNGNVWQYTMTDIPVDKNGEAIEYTMLEVDVDNYGTPVIETIRGDETTDNGVTYRPYSFVVTNSHTPEQIDITGEKVWDDANDQDGIRPQYVTLLLYADGEKVADTDVTAVNDTDGDGSWEWAFTGLDKYANGREIEYTVTEDAVEDYDTTITGDAADGFTVTNSYTPETTSISGSKTWVDDDNAANTRPASITVRLHANGSENVYEQTVTAADGWAWEFTDLPVYSNGQQIDYTLTEDAVDDYDTTYTFGDDGSLNVTNTLSPGNTSLTVDKDWEDNEDQDGIRPTEVTVELLRDGSATGDTVTLSKEDHWTDTFHNLQEYEGGVRIDYTVREVDVGDYDSAVSGDVATGYVITNSYTPETISLSGSKVWEDADDQDGIRPDSVTIHLLADGETVESKSVTADDNWEWTFTDLAKYAAGTEIVYTMEEVFVADGYEVTSGDASNNYTFTNTHEPEKIDITGTKTWEDDDNRDGIRPTSITVNLLADGEPVRDAAGNPVSTTVEPDAEGNWIYTFSDLDKCANGKAIDYSIAEDVPGGYQASYTYGGYDVSNSHTPELINGDGNLGVILRWDDDTDQDGLRPKRTTITLMVNGVPDETATLVLSDDNVDEYGNWIGTFTDLYKYEDGAEIAYNVEEGVMNGYTYTAELMYDEDTGRYYVEITNTHAAVTSDITVTKVWDDNDDQDGIRPNSVIVNLFSNGSAVKSVTLTPGKEGVVVSADGNEWSYTFENMPVDMNGEAILYTLDEVDVGSYAHEIETMKVEGNEKDGVIYTEYAFTVTNTHNPETTEVSGEKIWDDADDQDGLRPHSITIELLADGIPALDENGEEITQLVTPHTDGSWTWTFTDIPKYRDGGTEIVYSFEEFAVEGYETSYSADGRTITNTHEPETRNISGNKVWDDDNDRDGKRPASITVNLYANGLVYDTKTVTASDNWEWTFENVPEYANGQRITHVTTEVAIDEYVTTYSGFTLTNTYEPDKTSVTVIADWEDADDQDGIRPAEITVPLLADGVQTEQTLTLTGDENGIWEGTFTGLNEYSEGTRITYTIGEVSVDGYDCVVEGDAGEGFSLTFTHTPETINLEGSKTWDDADDQDGLRPDEITIHLQANGEEVLTADVTPVAANRLRKLASIVTFGLMSAEDDWSFEFTDLPKYANGQAITYTITETTVTGYDTTITGDAAEGFEIVNTHTPETTTISGTKEWHDANDQDGKRPANITLNLLADDTNVQSLVATDTDGVWGWEFTDLPKYEDGVEIAYTVTEDAVEGYETQIVGDAAGGYTVINSYTPETVTISGAKTWDDEEDQDGNRPGYVAIRLHANGEVIAARTVTAYDSWRWTFANQPKYEDGVEIAYTITEDAIDDYSTTVDGYDVTNSYTPGKTSMTVLKDWEDGNDQDGLRPKDITVELLADGESTGQTLKLNEGNNWEDTFTDLDEYDSGIRIEYTVAEAAVDGYESELTGNAAEGFVFTNTHTPETSEVFGSKLWADEDDQDGIRPENITIHLLADGSPVKSTVATGVEGANLWYWTFANLPKYQNGQEIEYTVTEDEVTGYTSELTGSEADGYVFTNTHEPETTTVAGAKTWNDANDQDGVRPESITVNLCADDMVTDTKTVTAADGWAWEFDGLPKYENGKAITYTITEDAINGYNTTVNGFDVTNTHEPETVSISGSKTWVDNDDQDGKRPAEITIRLHADGAVVDTATVTAAEDWAWTFADLPRYTSGHAITYTITEDALDDYSAAVNGYDVTNSYTPGQTSVTVTKTWEDNDDQDGIRPDSVTVELLANGMATGQTLTLSAANDWESTFSGLDAYESGEKVDYSIAEAAVEDYTSEITGDAVTGYVVTNTHEPETTTVAGTKTWDDNDDQDGKRPESISISLHANGTVVDTQTVTASDDWSWEFGDLPEYENGKAITYTITEDALDDYSAAVNGYDVTNSYTPGQTSVTVLKDWEDNDDQDGLRPDSVTVELLANGTATGDALTLSESNGWEGTFSGLDEYESGEKVDYSIAEAAVEDYTSEITGDAVTGYVVTNTHEPETTTVAGTKTWDDNDDQDGKRPESITIRLHANGEVVDTQTVRASDEWSWEFGGLPKYENGKAITYTITEDAVDDYSVTVDGYDVTNSYTPEQTSVTVVKDWEDHDDQDGIRPDSVTVELLANGTATGETLTLSAANSWEGTFTGLDAYESGEKITYSIAEIDVAGYTSEITGDAVTGYVVTNTHEPETTTVAGSKTWDDNDDQDGKRPESITIRLHANGEVVDTKTVTASDEWAWTFADLPAYAGGQKITHTITEDALDDYSAAVEGYDVTNSYTPGQTSVTVVKDWDDANDQDGVRPASITINLLANGTATGQTLTLSAANGWEGTFTGLDAYESGEKITYSVAEVDVAGYTSEITGDAETGYVITNTHEPEPEPETVTVSGSKTWDDTDNQDGKRPESITIRLQANGTQVDTKTVTEEDGWAWEFTDLPKYENDAEITYTITEDAVDDYSVTVDGYDVTNSYTPEQTSVTVVKDWDDANDQDGVRPTSITINLLANGTETGETLTLSESNGWEDTFTGLDVYEGGEKIAYTVSETAVDKYTSEITGDAVTGYVVTNTHEPASEPEPEPNPEPNPNPSGTGGTGGTSGTGGTGGTGTTGGTGGTSGAGSTGGTGTSGSTGTTSGTGLSSGSSSSSTQASSAKTNDDSRVWLWVLIIIIVIVVIIILLVIIRISRRNRK